MPYHDIEVQLPPRVVHNTDVRFVIHSDGVKLGELLVSRGSIDWLPASFAAPFELAWERFDELMREHGRHQPH